MACSDDLLHDCVLLQTCKRGTVHWQRSARTVITTKTLIPEGAPALIAASVWMAPGIRNPVGEGMDRLRPLTTPFVWVLERPDGFPMAYTY